MADLNALKKEVFDLTKSSLGSESYLFGTCVREYLTKSDIGTICVWSQEESDQVSFVSRLQSALKSKYGVGYSLNYVEQQDNISCEQREGWTLKVKGQTINLTFMHAGEYGDTFDTSDLDADINALCMSKFGDISSWNDDLNSTDVRSRMENKQFVPLPGASTEDTAKLISQGWTNLVGPKKEDYKVGDKVWFFDEGEIKRGTVSLINYSDDITINVDGVPNYYNMRANILGLWSEDEKDSQTETPLKEKSVSNLSVVDTFKSDLTESGWRTVAKQIPKAARGALLAFMKAKGAKKTWIKTVTEMMETESGRAALSLGMGWMLYAIPQLREDHRAQALAKEWRVEAMATFGDELVGELMQYFGPLMSMFQNLPEPPKVRVSAEEDTKAESKTDTDAHKEAEAEAEMELDLPPAKKTAKA